MSKPKILIVDDNDALCSLLSTMLYTSNVEVESVHTLAEANVHLHNGLSHSLIFLDNILPDGVGIDFLPILRTMNPKAEIVMMAGDYDETLRQKAKSLGCMDFLEKPFSYLKVSELVERVLKNTSS